MDKFNKKEYDMQYQKDHYTSCRIVLKPDEAQILTEYSQNLGISKNKLIKMCVKYCYKNMLDLNDLNVK